MPVSGARETVSVFEHWGQKRSIFFFCWCYCWVGGVELDGSISAAFTWLRWCLTRGKSTVVIVRARMGPLGYY